MQRLTITTKKKIKRNIQLCFLASLSLDVGLRLDGLYLDEQFHFPPSARRQLNIILCVFSLVLVSTFFGGRIPFHGGGRLLPPAPDQCHDIDALRSLLNSENASFCLLSNLNLADGDGQNIEELNNAFFQIPFNACQLERANLTAEHTVGLIILGANKATTNADGRNLKCCNLDFVARWAVRFSDPESNSIIFQPYCGETLLDLEECCLLNARNSDADTLMGKLRDAHLKSVPLPLPNNEEAAAGVVGVNTHNNDEGEGIEMTRDLAEKSNATEEKQVSNSGASEFSEQIAAGEGASPRYT